MSESAYTIPPGCICHGDGLMGMKCDAPQHAFPKRLNNNHRSILHREWMGTGGTVNWIMLNPSTATDTTDDPTIRKCIGFSKRWGFSGMVVTNLFTFRATSPDDLTRLCEKDYEWALGLNADKILQEEARKAKLVVAAWGTHGKIRNRGLEVLVDLARLSDVYCVGTTADGCHPLHPVRAPYTDSPKVFEVKIHEH